MCLKNGFIQRCYASLSRNPHEIQHFWFLIASVHRRDRDGDCFSSEQSISFALTPPCGSNPSTSTTHQGATKPPNLNPSHQLSHSTTKGRPWSVAPARNRGRPCCESPVSGRSRSPTAVSIRPVTEKGSGGASVLGWKG